MKIVQSFQINNYFQPDVNTFSGSELELKILDVTRHPTSCNFLLSFTHFEMNFSLFPKNGSFVVKITFHCQEMASRIVLYDIFYASNYLSVNCSPQKLFRKEFSAPFWLGTYFLDEFSTPHPNSKAILAHWSTGST